MKIKGTVGETEELVCEADFNQIETDVQCVVHSTATIGAYRCIVWRTSTSDGWAFTKVDKRNHELVSIVLLLLYNKPLTCFSR